MLKEYFEILQPFAEKFNFSVEEIRGNSRVKPLPDIRKIISKNLQEQYNISEIGAILNRNHATIINHFEKFNDLEKFNPEFRMLIEKIQDFKEVYQKQYAGLKYKKARKKTTKKQCENH